TGLDDRVLLASKHMDASVRVAHAEVAAEEPAVTQDFGCLLRLPQIFDHPVWPGDGDIADLASHALALRVEDLHSRTCTAEADTVRRLWVVAQLADATVTRLGLAVESIEFDVRQAFADLGEQRLPDRFSAEQDHLQRA